MARDFRDTKENRRKMKRVRKQQSKKGAKCGATGEDQ